MATGKTRIQRKATPKAGARKPAQNAAGRDLRLEVTGIALIVAGLYLLFCAVFSHAGFLGNGVRDFAMRMFGMAGRFFFAAFVLIHGVAILLKAKPFVEGGGSLYLYVMFVNILILLGFSASGIEGLGFGDRMLYARLWETPSAGGFLGSFLAYLLTSMLSRGGAWLFVLAVSLISFILVFSKSILSAIQARSHAEKVPAKSGASSASTKSQAQALMRSVAQETAAQARGRDGSGKNSGKASGKNSALDAFLQDSPPKPDIRISPAEVFSQKEKAGSSASKGKGDTSKNAANAAKDIKDFFDISSPAPPVESPAPGSRPGKQPSSAGKASASGDAPGESKGATDAKPRPAYQIPPMSLLDNSRDPVSASRMQAEVLGNAALLEKALRDFSIEASVSEVSVGPTVTRYELQLKPGIRVSKVVSLSDDIAMSLAALSVRIEAPIPGKSAVGIEVPNKEKTMVRLSQILTNEKFTTHKSPLAVALGKDLTGNDLILDVTSMPHLLIAGATGSGKSVCINTIIMSILYHSAPEDVRMILIDPKMVELSVYNEVPHLLIPVVTDPKDAAGALGWAVREMTQRYEIFVEHKVRGIDGYNTKMLAEGSEKMPHIILIIDELNDLMIVSAQAVETSIIRLSQLARAAGIHLVLATQRPTVNVITGVIKANIPTRISFSVMSQVDSRTILDMGGAEKLLGRGDMLYLPQDQNSPIRAQCAYVSDSEIEKVVAFVKKKQTAEYDATVMEGIKQGSDPGSSGSSGEYGDSMLPEAMKIAFEKNIISTSTIQRRLRLGYARAGRIIDEMEERGYISGADGSKPRKVLISMDEYYGGAS